MPRGDELFYRDSSGTMVAVPVRLSPWFSAGLPQRLFSGGYVAAGASSWLTSRWSRRR